MYHVCDSMSVLAFINRLSAACADRAVVQLQTVFGRFNNQALIELHTGGAAINDKIQTKLIKQCDTSFEKADEIVASWNEGKLSEIKDTLPDCHWHNQYTVNVTTSQH